MIIINKNKNNNIIFTLDELTTVDNPIYLLELYSNSDGDNKVIKLGLDISINKIRWNEFILEENDNEDLNLQIVSLNGTYDYFVWQSEIDSLNLEDAICIIESGKLIVNSIKPNSKTFNNNKKEFTFR